MAIDTPPPPPATPQTPTQPPESSACPCATIGPLLTAPGTSGRVWHCRECGKVWEPADATLAGALLGERPRWTALGRALGDVR